MEDQEEEAEGKEAVVQAAKALDERCWREGPRGERQACGVSTVHAQTRLAGPAWERGQPAVDRVLGSPWSGSSWCSSQRSFWR